MYCKASVKVGSVMDLGLGGILVASVIERHNIDDLDAFSEVFPVRTGFLQAPQVIIPEFCLVKTEFPQVLPAVDAGVMAVIKVQLHGIIAHRFDVIDFYILLACLQHFLPPAVTAHFCRGRIHPKEFGGQGIDTAIIVRQLQDAGFTMQSQIGRSHVIRV